jgi:T-complex protein 1 subunit beta
MASFNPTQIFDDGTTEEKGENARLSAFVGAIAVGDLGMSIYVNLHAPLIEL